MTDSLNLPKIHYIKQINTRISILDIFKVKNFEYIRYKIPGKNKLFVNKIKIGSKYSYIGRIKLKNEILENLKCQS